MKHQDRIRAELGAGVPKSDVLFAQLSHERRPDVPVIYLVWGLLRDGGAQGGMNGELRAVTSYEARAELYKAAVERENEYRRTPYTHVFIEKTWLNHLLGHSMMRALYRITHAEQVEAVLAEEDSRGA